jgi:carbon-monoxide dehydrogenase medium subunit
MALGLAGPESLIAAGERPADLAYIRVERGELRIGALTRRTEVAYSPLVSEHCSVLGEAIRADSGRTRGGPATIGASLCRYRATGGVRDALSAAHASVIIRSRQGGRIVPVREFGRPGSPPVSPRELLTEVRIPIAAAGRPGRS